jgi:hypothetical protein
MTHEQRMHIFGRWVELWEESIRKMKQRRDEQMAARGDIR